MFRTLIDRLLKRDRSTSRRKLSRSERRAAFLHALQSRTSAEVATWTHVFRNIVKHQTRRRGTLFQSYLVPALRLEALEDRRMLAAYDWDGAGTLAITLAQDEDLTIAEDGGGNRTFTIDTGAFNSTNVAATGDTTAMLTFGNGAGDDISTSISVGNTGAGAGTNNVTFDGGIISSNAITIDANFAGTTSAIDFATATTSFISLGGAVTLTANGADITDSSGGVFSTSALTLSASGQAIVLDNPLNNLFVNAVPDANSLTIADTGSIVFGILNVTDAIEIRTGGDVTFENAVTADSLDVDTDATGGTGGNIITNNLLTIAGATVLDAGDRAIVLANAANDLGTSLTTTSTDDQYLVDRNGLTSLNLNAGTGNITLTAGGAIQDADGAVDIVADDLILTASGGIGMFGSNLETEVNQMDVSNATADPIFITDSAGGLVLTDLGGPNGNAVDAAGGGSITANSPLTIAADAITSGGFTYTATDSGAGDDLTVNMGVTVRDMTAGLTLNAGDNLVISTGALVRADTTLTLNLDFGDNDGGGETANIFGTITAGTAPIMLNGSSDDNFFNLDNNGGTPNDGGLVAVAANLQVNGGGGDDTLTMDDSGDPTADAVMISNDGAGDGTITGLIGGGPSIEFNDVQQVNLNLGDAGADTVTVTPNEGTAFALNGNAPTTTPGDTLVFDLTGLTATLTLVPNSTGFDGMLTAPGVDNIVFDNFESFDTTGVTFDVVLNVNGGDMAADGTADETRLELVGTDLRVTVDDGTNAPSIRLPLGAILSLQVIGSADDDLLRIVDNGDGVPSFPGMATSAHSNAAFEAVTGNTAADIGIDFDAGGGINALGLDLTAANVAYFSDSVALPSSGVISVDAAGAGGIGEFAVSFNQLAPIGIFVAGPGSLLVDASANPAVTSLAIDDDALWAPPVLPLFTTFPLPLPGAAGDGISMIYEPSGAAGFETVQFTGFSDVTVRSGPGSDLIDLIAIDHDGILTDMILDADTSFGGPDLSDDVIQVQSLPGPVTATLMGGPDTGGFGDLYLLDSLTGALDAVLGLVVANPVMSPSPAFPAPEEGGVETLSILDTADTTADTIVVTATTIDGVTGEPAGPPAGITYGPGPGGDIVETVTMSLGTGGNTVNVQSTAAGSTHNYATGPGDDTVNISSDAPANAGDLNGIDGQINLNTGGGAGDVLNLSDTGDGTADTYVFGLAGPATTIDFADGAATPDITFNAPFGPADQLETFNITGGTGNDTFTNFVAAGGTALTAMMFATTNNTFNGNDGNDTFDFEWSDGFNLAAGTNFVINGGNVASNSENRDEVTLDTTADTGGARTIGITFANATSGDVDVTGLRAGGGVIDINTTETLFYDGGGAVDPVTVTGTAADDDLTVALRDTNDAALVFRGGNPYLQAPPDSIGGNLPGVAGGGSGPDISLNGIDDTLTLDGGGNTGTPGLGDRALVYAASEAAITTGGTLDVFGFGAGILIPGFGAGNAWDEIDVNNTTGPEDFSPAEVDVRNNNFGQLVSVDIVEATFDQAGPPASAERSALIVNGGDEAMARPSGVSDRFSASPSALFNIQVNGNLPSAGPVGPDGFPIGDELTLVSPVSINVFSDKATPPNVSTTFGNSIFGIRDSSIERKRLLPGNGVLNLIGDNNNPAVDQADNFVVVGRDVDSGGSPDAGFQEMTLRINGSAPILIDNVSDMNVYGFDLVGEADLNAPNPNRPDAGAGGIDTLDISPYADDTPRGWGVDVLFNEGLPAQADGAQADLLIVHTSLFGGQVSEDITIRPSGMDAGEVIITNSSFGTPIVDIDYVGNTDIIVLDDDGFANDTDTLTLLGTNPDNPGTSGNETIDANFGAAGGVGTPLVNVRDGATILYNVRNFSGFDTINFATLGGDDTLNVAQDSANTNGLQNLNINFNGGPPDGSDTLALEVTTGIDLYVIEPGASSDAGKVTQDTNGAGVASTINFVNTEAISIDDLGLHASAGIGGIDLLTLEGTGNADNVDLSAAGTAGPDGGTARVNDGPNISFDDLGTGSDIVINTGLGADTITAKQEPGWLIDSVLANMGGPPLGNTFNLGGTNPVAVPPPNGDDAFVYTATGEYGGTLALTTGGTTTTYTMNSVTSANIDGLGQAAGTVDSLTSTLIASSFSPDPLVSGRGILQAEDAVGNPLLGLNYDGIESPVISGTTITIQGTEGNDQFVATVTDLDLDGMIDDEVVIVNGNPINIGGYTNVVLNGLGGDDSFGVLPNPPGATAPLTLGTLSIIGGDNGTASDNLTVFGTTGNDNIGVNLAANQVTGVIGGSISFTGIENLGVGGGTAPVGDTITVTDFGAFSGLQLLAIAANNLAGDAVTVAGTAGDDTINFNPTDASSGEITRDGTDTTINYANMNAAAVLTVQGGSGGFDVLHVLGTEDVDTVTTPTATSVMRDDIVTFDAATIDRLDISTFGGNDSITMSNGINIPKIIDAGAGDDTVDASAAGAADPTIFGGIGNDTITGSPGPDLIFGGPGDDSISGLAGNDTIYGNDGNDAAVGGTGSDLFFGGDGSDTFSWFQGDGSDVIEGDGGGADAVVFNGANVAEVSPEAIAVSASNGRVVFTRGITLNMAGVERLDVNGVDSADPALGGVENITVNDLSTTELAELNIDLQGNAMADGVADSVTVNAPATDDNIGITQSGTTVNVTGLGYDINVTGALIAENDVLTINGNDGHDTIAVGAGVEADIDLSIDGGSGHDVIDASQTVTTANANITLAGGAGNDMLLGGGADETLNGNAGDDVIHPGAGANTVDGGTGSDQYIPGGGTDTVTDGGGTADSILIDGTGGNDSITVALNGVNLDVTVNGVLTTFSAIAGAGIDRVEINSGAGDDTITVDALASIAYDIDADSPTASDTLNVNVAGNARITQGATSTSGVVDNTGAGDIDYDGVEFLNIVSAGGGSTLTVRATHDNDTIAIAPTATANEARVWINDGTVITGNAGGANNNFATIDLQGRFGDDSFSVSPIAGISMTIAGGDPLASDRVTVNGTTAANNTTITPSGPAAGFVQVDALGLITINTTESLTYAGDGGNDLVIVVAPANAVVDYTPGPTDDSADVRVNDLVPFSLTNLGSGGQAVQVASGGNATLVYHGTTANDVFGVSAGTPATDGRVTFNAQLPVETSGVTSLVLDALEGDDIFNVTGPQPYTQITLEGGNPDSGSDVANLTGDGSAMSIDIGEDPTDVWNALVWGGGLAAAATPLTTTGIEEINLDAGAGAITFTRNTTVNTVADDQDYSVTPTGANTATVQTATSPRVNTTNDGTLSIADGDTTDSDSVTVNGTSEGEMITVVRGAATTVTVSGRKAVDVTSANAEHLIVKGGAGNDTIAVSGTGGPALTVDGGSQAGTDTLTITNTAIGLTTVRPGTTSDAGTINTPDTTNDTAFVGIEAITLTGAAATDDLQVHGTNDNDTITLAGPNRVWVNDRAPITFASFDNIEIDANLGDDKITVTPTDLTDVVGVNVIGRGPTASDELIVNGTAGVDDMNILFTPSGPEAGSVDIDSTLATVPVVTFLTIESVVIAGQGGNDDITVNTSNGSQRVTVTPGATVDSGGVRVDSLVPMTFVNLGATGTLTIDDTGAGVDEVVYEGTDGSDTFGVAGIQTITLNDQIDVQTIGVENYTLKGKGGDDTFNITPVGTAPAPAVIIHVEGDEPGSGSDVLNYTANAAAQAVGLNLGTSTVTQTTFGDVNYSGIETINLDASANSTTVTTTDDDDQLSITPFSATTGRLQNNGVAPVVNYEGIGANTITLALGNGEDVVTVHGNSSDETIDVNSTAGQIQASGQTIVHGLGTDDALTVNGAQGDDTFNVTAADYPIFIDGGDPIGVTGPTAPSGDRIAVNAAAAITFTPGPQSDEGSFDQTGFAPISFDHIERVDADANGNAVTVCGTTGDDDITVVGTGPLAATVTVNAGPLVSYTELGDLTIEGKSGDDDIDVDVNDLALAGATGFNINGGDPSADADTLTVTGVAGDMTDGAIWQPTGADAGDLQIGGQLLGTNPINVGGIETLIYDGENEAEGLTVRGDGTGAGNAERFVHTPIAADAGSIAVTSVNNTLLGISYVNLGLDAAAVTIDGQGGIDTLVAKGTEGNDTVNVLATSGNIDLHSNAGNHIDLARVSVEDLVVETFGGDDTVNVTGPQPYSTITLSGGTPSNTDVTNLTGDGTAVVVDMGTQPVSVNDARVSGGGLGIVTVTGFEEANVNALGGDITVNGATDPADVTLPLAGVAYPESFRVTPTGADTATIRRGGAAPVLNTTNTGLLTIAEGNAGDGDTVTVDGTSAADIIAVTRGASTTVLVGALKLINVTAANVESLVIAAGAGDDQITVSGMFGTTTNLTVDGGNPSNSSGGNDRVIVNTAAGTTTVSPGATPDAGTVDVPAAGAAENVGFVNVENLTINATTAGDVLAMNGTHGDDTIALQNLGGNNLVWVNDRSVTTFTTFGTVTLAGRFGDDKINVHPVGLVGVTAINVQGGDSTTADEVLINGTAAMEAIAFNPTATNAATVTVGASAPVSIATSERVSINGLGGGDTLTTTSPAGPNTVTYTPGSTVDSGDVLVDSLLPMNFRDLDDTGAAGTQGALTFADAGAVRDDTLVHRGSSTNDVFIVPGTDTATLSNSPGTHVVANLTGVNVLTLQGLTGDDTFNVTPQAGILVNVEGDEPSASDVLNFTTATGPTTLDLGNATIDDTGVAGGVDVNYTGIETINLNAGGASPTIMGTADDDDLTVTLLSATSGRAQLGANVQRAGEVASNPIAPVVNYSNTGAIGGAGNPLIVDLIGGEDTLLVVGNALQQTFGVNLSAAANGAPAVPARTVSADDRGDGSIDGSVNWLAGGIESLEVFGLEGDDAFNVTPGPISVFIDGGDPIGTSAGDLITVDAGGNAVTFETGPEPDEGGIIVATTQRISYDHIEALGAINAMKALIVGTNGDDDITVIARDVSTHVGANGMQDFTVSVNAGPAILFLDTPDLYIDALSGDDDVVLRTPAPNDASWNVDVYISGGAPSDGAPNEGDRFVVETPGQDNIVYTPTGSDTGTILIDENDNQLNDGNDSLITLGQFTFTCPGITYTSDPGGVELFEYDGEGGNDMITVVGTSGTDTIVHTPGTGTDEGSFRVNNLLGIDYQNVGPTSVLTVDGVGQGAGGRDRLVVNGTNGNDVFEVASTTGAITLRDPASSLVHRPINTVNVEALTLEALDGDDSFILNTPQPYTQIAIAGGSPGGSDRLGVIGAVGVAQAFTVSPGVIRGEGRVDVDGLQIPYRGVEHLLLGDLAGNGAGATDSLVVNDDFSDNAWNVGGGLVGDLVQIDDRESIDISGFNTVNLVNQSGTDHFRIAPTNMTFSFLTSFTVTGDAAAAPEPVDDVLELIGTEGADVITAGATTVTVNGVTITAGNTNFAELRINALGGNDVIGHDGVGGNPAPLALALTDVRKVVEAGAGSDVVNMSLTMDADIFGGDGDDNIVGTPLADNIYGGSGNDTIFGLAGDDTVYGGDGNDVATGGTGSDRFFGGDGSDTFIWNQGDGSDLIEGDGGGADVVQFNGATAAQVATENFALSANTTAPNTAARILLARTQGGVNLDIAGVEQIDINGDTGAETFVVNDLAQTELKVLNLNLGLAGDTEATTVNARSLDDNLQITLAAGIVNVAGLQYDVNIAAAVAAAPDNDRLTVNGNDGNDVITIADNVEGTIDMTLSGGAGSDHLTAGLGHTSNDTILNGDAGDDFLQGGSGGDSINGGVGEDTMVGRGGQDTYDGGADFDTILIPGTSGADVIRVEQPSATVLEYIVTDQFGTDVQSATVAGGTQDVIANVEEARVEAGNGADTIRVAISDTLFDQANASLRMTIEGGDDAASDRLAIVDDTGGAGGALPDASILRQNHDITAGTVEVGPANAERFLHVFSGIEFVQVVADTLTPTAPVNIESAGIPNRLVVFKDDGYEHNNDRNNATHLGANTTVNLDPTIDPGPGAFALPGDNDWYRVEALVSGTIDFQVVFEQIDAVGARPGLPGNGDLNINVFDADGTAIANFNTSDDDDDNERARIPAVQGEIYYFQVVGDVNANGAAINAYDVTVINLPAAIPFDLELDDEPANGQTNPPGTQTDNSDTGRSLFDNRTYDNTPTIIFRLDDGFFLNDLPGNNAAGTPLGDSPIPIPFRAGLAQPNMPGYAIAIFDEGETAPAAGNAGNLNIRQPLGFATQLEPGLYSFTVPNNLALEDGSHFLTARVQMLDPATPLQTGWGERSESMEIIVDRVPPQSFFGFIGLADTSQGLAAANDSGVNGYPATNVDRVTSDTTPSFFGTAEADAIVRVYVNTNGVAGLQSRESGAANPDLFLGLAVASPLDGEGTNQFPRGQWQIDSNLDLNNPSLGFVQDGLRQIFVTAEDLSGNITPDANADLLNIFLDTRGPQVTRVDVNTRNNAAYNIWDHKGTPDGGNDGLLIPTPLVNSVVVSVRDLPNRSNADANFLYQALFTPVSIDPGHYQLVGDYNGVIPIQSITFTSDTVTNGNPATGFVTISFFVPLPDDRFTLTLSDDITDRVGNRLDGETNTFEPHDTQGTLPSGDGVPGGDFVARFTVDSRPELGVWASGTAWIDTNGNETIDPRNADFVNRDIIYTFGNGNPGTNRAFTSDDFFAGNFVQGAGGTADGFDKLAVYGSTGQTIAGPWRWLIDTDNDGVPNINVAEPSNVNGLPVAGNFDGNATNGDEVGLFDGNSWWLDTTHSFTVDTQIVSPLVGYPIVGDFDGDGLDDLATWADDQFQFDLANDGFGDLDAVINFGFIGVRERPLAADLDQDGIDDIGLWSPDLSGITPNERAEWFFLVSNDPTGANRVTGQVNTLNHAFEPVPFGNDLYMQLGTAYSIPIIGNFDPPPSGGVIDLTEEEVTDILNRLDVNQDGHVTPLDALIVINSINRKGSQAAFSGVERLMDVNADGTIAPSDVLAIFNYLTAHNFIQGEGEGSAAFASLTTETSAAPVAATPSEVMEVADGQFIAAADTMRIVFAPLASAATELEDLFALFDNADEQDGATKDDDASSIDMLLAFKSDDLFAFDNLADDAFGSALNELLGDDELFDLDELATDVLKTYDKGDDLV